MQFAKASLKLKIVYRLNGTPIESIRSQIEQIITKAELNGDFTGSTPAEVEALYKNLNITTE